MHLLYVCVYIHMSHGTHIWVMAHIYESWHTYIYESRLLYVCVYMQGADHNTTDMNMCVVGSHLHLHLYVGVDMYRDVCVQVFVRVCVMCICTSARSCPQWLPVCIMRWLRLVGSLKFQVTFAKEPYKRDDILQKRPIILRSLRIVSTPYEKISTHIWWEDFDFDLLSSTNQDFDACIMGRRIYTYALSKRFCFMRRRIYTYVFWKDFDLLSSTNRLYNQYRVA